MQVKTLLGVVGSAQGSLLASAVVGEKPAAVDAGGQVNMAVGKSCCVMLYFKSQGFFKQQSTTTNVTEASTVCMWLIPYNITSKSQNCLSSQ